VLLQVKARLYKQNQEELSTFSAGMIHLAHHLTTRVLLLADMLELLIILIVPGSDARKEKLQEMYSELERTYEALLRKLHSGASE